MYYFAYIGCYTTQQRKAQGTGIGVYRVEDGVWTHVQTARGTENPSYLCLDRTERFLYAVHGDMSEISAFRIDEGDGSLTPLGGACACGVNPVHLSVSPNNRWIYVANLQTGTVAVLPRKPDGTLGACRSLYEMPGNGEGCCSHPHQALVSPKGDYLFVSCQGRERGFGQVRVFRIDEERGTLLHTCTVRARQIAEPRHMVCMSDGARCFGVNEIDYTVTAYRFDGEAGRLEARSIVPTLPQTCTQDGWASGIALDQSQRFLVVSNRKHESLSCFRVLGGEGGLALCDCVKTCGINPRFITVDPGNGHVLAANEISGDLRAFRIDADTGKLCRTDFLLMTPSPSCVIFKTV